MYGDLNTTRELFSTTNASAQINQLRQLSVGKFETDSRKVQAGDIFVCRQGLARDSHDFANDAIQRGAIGLITHRRVDTHLPCIQTPGYSVSVSLISQFYQHPQDQMFNIGVTGTNGKTTVAYSLKQLIDRKYKAAYTGTLGCVFDGYEHSLVNTTPDAITLLNLINDMKQAINLLTSLEPVPGRSEVINLSNGASAIIDYAHNLDSLETLLTNARQHTNGKITTVVGVTGDRLLDAEAIGTACSRLSDVVYFTCDNPLGFEPESIVHSMSRKADPSRYRIELDRSKAIQKAMARLNSGDVLLVCGKGHEAYQYMSRDKGNPVPYIGDAEAIHLAARQYGLSSPGC